ncbi:hypothetical protein Tco_0449566 [Tanacetum coccineum]
MSNITSIKCDLTQEHLNSVCSKYFVLEEVHPQLPGPNDTMHERPAGKVGMYTRFFDYANYHQAPVASEYNAEHASILITHASPFLRFPEEFLCWVGISRNYLLNKDTYPRFEYESDMDLNAFIRTADPRKVRIVERARAENEEPIVTMAKHRTVTLLPTSVVRPSGELSASVEREFVEDAGGSALEPRRSKKKRVTYGSEGIPAASHPPKRLRADYGTTGGSAVGGKSPSVLNRLLQDSLLMVEQGVPALPTLPFITSSLTASPLEEGGDHTDSVPSPSLRTVGPSARFVVLSDSSHHSGAKSADPEVDSFFRFVAPVMTTATTVTAFVSSVAPIATTSVDVGKDNDESAPSVFACSSSSDKTDRTLSLFTGKSGSEFVAGSIRAGGDADKSLAEEKDNLLQVKDKEIEDLRSQLLRVKDESMEVAQLDHNALKLKMTSLESTIAEKDHELSNLGTSTSSFRSQNQSLMTQVHELETSSAGLRDKLEMYEGSMRQLEEFQDSLMKPFEARLAEIDADFTRCCMHFQENFHSHLLNAIAGWRWLLTHGMKLLMAKCLNSTEFMEALGNAFDRAIEKGMHEGLAAGIEHGQAGRCLNLSAKKDANTLIVMDLLRLDDAVAEVLRMTDLQPDVGQLMVLVHHKQDKVVIRSQALSVTLETCHRRVRKMERNIVERLPFLKDVFVSIDHPISAEALAILSETSIEPPITALITTALSTVVIRLNSDPFLLVKDYENLNLAGVVSEDVIPGPEGEGKVEGSTKDDVDDRLALNAGLAMPLMHFEFCL